MCSSDLGGNQWSYLTANDALLSYDAVSGLWNGAQLYQLIWNGGIHPGPTEGTKLRWTAPAAGTAIIGGSAALLTSAGSYGVTLEIEHEGFSVVGPTSLTTTAPITINETVVVLAGDVIDFDSGIVRLDGQPVQAELSQLLTLLATPPGRVALAGLSSPWPQASVAQVQEAMQGMRLSSLALKQQAYHALRDLTNAAYFSDPSAWQRMGYPGPTDI